MFLRLLFLLACALPGRAELVTTAHPISPSEAKIGERSPVWPWATEPASPVTAVIFLSPTCPLSAKLMPSLAALAAEFRPRGVAFEFIGPTAADSAEALANVASQHRFEAVIRRDPDLQIARALSVRSTTETLVFDAARTLVYRGAVDDQYSLGSARDAPQNQWLRDALTAALAGQRPRIAATTAPGCVLEYPAENPARTAITWHGQIARLMQTHCQECHRASGIGPFPLETYTDLVSRAGMVRGVIEDGLMPPWFAAPPSGTGHRPFMNDRTLPTAAKADLLAWLASDRPEGDPAEAPRPRRWPDALWAMGQPDQIIEIPRAVDIQATGRMAYVHQEVPTTHAEDQWIQAIEVQPTARAHVHHVLVFVTLKDQNGKTQVRDPNNFFAAYVPGSNILQYPAGTAKRLPAGATLLFQLHYTPNGTAAVDRTRLGLKFATEPPVREVLTAAAANHWIRILPGAPDHEEKAFLPITFDAEILAFMPHMHVRGKAFRYDLVDPTGARRTLLDVPRFDFNWQLLYRLAEPIAAPRGSKLEVRALYDNSPGNPANPDPAKVVRWGNQTEDEMLLGYVEYVNPATNPRAASATRPRERPVRLTRKALARLGQALDLDGDAKISRLEAGDQYADLHAQLDANHDGFVSHEEVKAQATR
jgi:thiol-disulfide isomerase/thioredoxin